MQDGLKEPSPLPFLYISGLLARLRQTFECLRESKFRQGKFFCLMVLLLLAVTFQKV